MTQDALPWNTTHTLNSTLTCSLVVSSDGWPNSHSIQTNTTLNLGSLLLLFCSVYLCADHGRTKLTRYKLDSGASSWEPIGPDFADPNITFKYPYLTRDAEGTANTIYVSNAITNTIYKYVLGL